MVASSAVPTYNQCAKYAVSFVTFVDSVILVPPSFSVNHPMSKYPLRAAVGSVPIGLFFSMFLDVLPVPPLALNEIEYLGMTNPTCSTDMFLETGCAVLAAAVTVIVPIFSAVLVLVLTVAVNLAEEVFTVSHDESDETAVQVVFAVTVTLLEALLASLNRILVFDNSSVAGQYADLKALYSDFPDAFVATTQ